jgi:hypothetical protein
MNSLVQGFLNLRILYIYVFLPLPRLSSPSSQLLLPYLHLRCRNRNFGEMSSTLQPSCIEQAVFTGKRSTVTQAGNRFLMARRVVQVLNECIRKPPTLTNFLDTESTARVRKEKHVVSCQKAMLLGAWEEII